MNRHIGSRSLRGKRVAALAADGFEYIELSVPDKALRAAGAEVHVVSLHRGKIRGMNLTEPTKTVRVDKTLEEASADDYDALFLPGGFVSPDLLRQSQLAREFVRAFDVRGKPIATLCHGPWVLVSAERVSGRHLSAWPGIRDDIVHAGGVWHDSPLVVDQNWVSSRGPQDLAELVPATLELFATGAVREHAGGNGALHGSLPSPKAERPPAVAVAGARVLPGPALRTVAMGALGTIAAILLARRRE